MEDKIIVNTYSNEIYSKIEMTLYYINKEDKPLELIIEIPIRTELIFDSFIARIKDKIIKSKIIETEKAKEKYNDAIAKGNTGVTTSYNLEEKLYSVKIGNLPPKEILELKCYFIQFISLNKGFLCLNIIKDFPKILNFTPNQVRGEVIIETNSEITEIAEIEKKGKFFDEKKKFMLNYENNEIEKIMFKTKNMSAPLLIRQYNPVVNETNYIFNVFNVFNSFNEKNEKLKGEKYPCLFILIIDQSGSMSETIKDVSKTLSNLIESFPPDSYYQLIGFGTTFKKYDLKPKINSKENISNSLEIINSLEAHMGGTNLSSPIEDILKNSYSDYQNIPLSKQIIVLTDGQINFGDNTIELIQLHNNEFKIHLIGIGSDVNKNSIINISKAGNGSYHFINDISDLKNEIFEILNDCTEAYINNYSFILDTKTIYELQPINKITYVNESLNYCFIKEDKNNDDINIKFNWENLNEKHQKEYKVNSNEILEIKPGEELSKLIIGLSFKYNIISTEKEQIYFSKKYQVLSKYTTLFADIENDNPITNEIKIFEKKNKDRNFGCSSCGKYFLSQPALYVHYKTKHSELAGSVIKGRGRGRARKYPPRSSDADFEKKYENFFDLNNRGREEGKNIDLNYLIPEVFKFIYESKYSDKLFSKIKSYKDNPILNNLSTGNEISNKTTNEKTCDEVFYEYLSTFKDKTNQNYFSLLIKFIILIREFYNEYKNKEIEDKDKHEVTNFISAEELPDLCNNFYQEFLENNNFFGLTDDEKKEIVEIILHFSLWLYKNNYTKSKLSFNTTY